MNLLLEQRLARVEKSVAGMRRLVTKMYQTFYAARVRRSNTYGRMMKRMGSTLRAMEDRLPLYARLARLTVSLDKGRSVVTLDPREFNQLKELLRRQRPFRPRP